MDGVHYGPRRGDDDEGTTARWRRKDRRQTDVPGKLDMRISVVVILIIEECFNCIHTYFSLGAV